MIELIFVIVILGILAAVAIPKLAATRDDAKISKLASNVATLVSDAGSYYTSQGSGVWNDVNQSWAAITNVELSTSATTQTNITADAPGVPGTLRTTTVYMLGGENISCFTITSGNDGELTVAEGDQAASTICAGAIDIAGTTVATHNFGGVGVVR